jgi:anthranilate phosphoribosyltransferase
LPPFEWPAVLSRLASGHDLAESDAAAAMAEVLEGNATPAQIAAFIFGLRCKGETVEEMTGMVGAMLSASERVPLPASLSAAVVDTCGTGGDRSGTINVSTIAALVVAGAGVPVCKHGGRAASSRAGSADVLEALGVVIDLGPEGVARCVAEAGIGFCFAPRYHPAMRHAIPVRRELGVPTAFNFLGPLANPARVRRQVVGVGDPAMAPKMVGVLAASGATDVMVVHGAGGLDELSTLGPSVVHAWRDGELSSFEVSPAGLGLAPAALADLGGGDAGVNAEYVRRVLGGAPGAHRDIVVLNAAAGLVVGGMCGSIEEGLAAAASSIDDGKAAGALERLVAVSKAAAA